METKDVKLSHIAEIIKLGKLPKGKLWQMNPEHAYNGKRTKNQLIYQIVFRMDAPEDNAQANIAGSLPSKDKAVNIGFKKATSAGYNYRRVCREPDHDIYYSGWMDCYDWLSANNRQTT